MHEKNMNKYAVRNCYMGTIESAVNSLVVFNDVLNIIGENEEDEAEIGRQIKELFRRKE